jgi:hypothetical protein
VREGVPSATHISVPNRVGPAAPISVNVHQGFPGQPIYNLILECFIKKHFETHFLIGRVFPKMLTAQALGFPAEGHMLFRTDFPEVQEQPYSLFEVIDKRSGRTLEVIY